MANGALAVFLQKIAFPEEGQIKFIYCTFSENSAFCLEHKPYAPNKCVHACVHMCVYSELHLSFLVFNFDI